jgi:hypothetical protein
MIGLFCRKYYCFFNEILKENYNHDQCNNYLSVNRKTVTPLNRSGCYSIQLYLPVYG